MVPEVDLYLTGQKQLKSADISERHYNDLDMNEYDLSINYNNKPYNSDICILVTSYYGHLKWLKQTLKKYRESGAFVLCAYDHPYKGWSNLAQGTMSIYMPRPDHLILADSWVYKHITYDGNKRNGWFWSVKYANSIIRQFNFKYVFCVNSDCIWDKPEGLSEIIEILGDGDLMANSSTSTSNSTELIHTASVIYKIDAFNKIVDYMTELMKVSVIGSRSPEIMLKEAVELFKLKEIVAQQQPIYPKDGTIDHYTCYGQPSTWRTVLGYRNLFSELETASIERLEPISKKYLDFYENNIYFAGWEQETLCNYYKTNDRRYLMRWHDQGAESDYDRKYFPLEHYGKEPLYGPDNGRPQRIEVD